MPPDKLTLHGLARGAAEPKPHSGALIRGIDVEAYQCVPDAGSRGETDSCCVKVLLITFLVIKEVSPHICLLFTILCGNYSIFLVCGRKHSLLSQPLNCRTFLQRKTKPHLCMCVCLCVSGDLGPAYAAGEDASSGAGASSGREERGALQRRHADTPPPQPQPHHHQSQDCHQQ